MSLNVISEYNNELLGRKDIVAEVDFSGATPSKVDISKMIASKTGVDEKLVIIKVIDTEYGNQKAKVKAFAYNSKDDLKKLEKVEEKEEVAPEGAAPVVEAPKVEAPTEEKKEETPEKPKVEKSE